jgi:hypothetical protein
MNNKVGAVILIAIVAGVAGAFVVRQNGARAQAQQALAEQAQFQALAHVRDAKRDNPPRWEYRVLTSSGGDRVVIQEISELTDDGWEFVAVIQPALPTGTPARILFKRPKQ